MAISSDTKKETPSDIPEIRTAAVLFLKWLLSLRGLMIFFNNHSPVLRWPQEFRAIHIAGFVIAVQTRPL